MNKRGKEIYDHLMNMRNILDFETSEDGFD